MNNKKLKTKTEKTGTWKKEYRKNQSKKGRPEAWLWFLHFFSEAYVVVFYFFRGNICCTSGGSTMFLAQSQIMLLPLKRHRLCFSQKETYTSTRNTIMFFIGALFFSRSLAVFRKKNEKQFSKIHENYGKPKSQKKPIKNPKMRKKKGLKRAPSMWYVTAAGRTTWCAPRQKKYDPCGSPKE